ncbi:MAG: tetratricopeptide repeat protein [Planctomycetia bacterium]
MKNIRRQTAFAVAVLAVGFTNGAVGFYDSDNAPLKKAVPLDAEWVKPSASNRFPETTAVIVGRFPRHSSEFYEWRFRELRYRVRHNPDDLTPYDDLAVAYFRAGEPQRGIDRLLEKDERSPGSFTTNANLGLMFVRQGDLKTGMERLGQAVDAAPADQRDRVRLQFRLVDHLLLRQKYDADPDAAVEGEKDESSPSWTFAESLTACKSDPTTKEEILAVIPLLASFVVNEDFEPRVALEALADVLTHYATLDANVMLPRLAAMAYLKAADAARSLPERRRLRGRAGAALQGSTTTLEALEKDFEAMATSAGEWSDEIWMKEVIWITNGQDPEKEFANLFFAADADPHPVSVTRSAWVLSAAVGLLAAVGLVAVGRRRRSASAADAPNC